jgi:hypothetical protein
MLTPTAPRSCSRIGGRPRRGGKPHTRPVLQPKAQRIARLRPSYRGRGRAAFQGGGVRCRGQAKLAPAGLWGAAATRKDDGMAGAVVQPPAPLDTWPPSAREVVFGCGHPLFPPRRGNPATAPLGAVGLSVAGCPTRQRRPAEPGKQAEGHRSPGAQGLGGMGALAGAPNLATSAGESGKPRVAAATQALGTQAQTRPGHGSVVMEERTRR